MQEGLYSVLLFNFFSSKEENLVLLSGVTDFLLVCFPFAAAFCLSLSLTMCGARRHCCGFALHREGTRLKTPEGCTRNSHWVLSCGMGRWGGSVGIFSLILFGWYWEVLFDVCGRFRF